MRDITNVSFVGVDPTPRSGIFRTPPPVYPDAHPFLAWLLGRAGIRGNPYLARGLDRRLAACLRALHANSPDEAQARLERRPDLVPDALDAVLLGVTQFFRDSDVFDRLAHDILPALAAGGRFLRVCSAGCSDGRELASVGLLLDELGLLGRAELVGVDIRPLAIHRARAGRYDSDALAPLRYDRRARLARVLARCHFRVADLLEPGALAGPFDLLLCRNLAIYLQPQAARALWTILAGQLAPGGVLVTGKAEHPNSDLPFSRIGPCLYRRGAR